MSGVVYLTLDDVLEIGRRVMDDMSAEFLVRDMGLLESAVHRPQAEFYGQEAYPTLELKAAALMESLARSHTLVDGNKRLAWAATKLFLLFNGRRVPVTNTDVKAMDEAETFMWNVASGVLPLNEIAAQLQEWAEPVTAD